MSLHICAVFQPFMRGLNNFRQRGPGQSDKKALSFFSPQLILQKSNGRVKLSGCLVC